ncbi:prephenate dehydratase [Gnomoniopsis smithogilvyi]|uniref:Prephenate dehydratase n=1 Tax=Gnomoniopsis smithogilvyi TaxID=1191159 RepID=A0A9W8YXF0_9PEZI|nr:prephenate dehydratase [Gnomoniopsis smithogilvyi]
MGQRTATPRVRPLRNVVAQTHAVNSLPRSRNNFNSSQIAEYRNVDMRTLHSSCASWRHLNIKLSPKAHITTRAATFASIRNELLSRQPQTHIDQVGVRSLTQLFISLPPLHISKNRQNDFYLLRSPLGAGFLPQGHHLVFNNSMHPVESLLPDGTDSDHSPGPPFTRRVWAGGSLAFSQGWKSRITLDHSNWVCRETITDVRLRGALPEDEISFESAPSSNHKIFVDVERLYSLIDLPNDPFIVERRTLCFMAPKSAGDITRVLEQPSNKPIRSQSNSSLFHDSQLSLAYVNFAISLTTYLKTNLDLTAPRPFPEDCATSFSRSFNFTPAMLFRFSALTFNAHKIHLDTQHCLEVEGYRNLLVHGPLLLMLIFSVFNSRGHIVDSLDYQNLAPVFVDEEIKVCIQQRKSSWSVWITGPQGDLRVKGTAILERGGT